MQVLGIDPGSRITGFAVIESLEGKLRCVQAGCLRLDKVVVGRRLGVLLEACQELCAQFHVDALSIEQVFMYQNAQTALKLGQVRGVVMALAQSRKIPVFEYAPRLVKLTVVGTGSAEKVQVQHMVQMLLGLSKRPQVDCADAMAIALCHLQHEKGLAFARKKRSTRSKRRWTEHDCKTLRKPD